MKFLANLVATILFLGILALSPGFVRDSLADQTAKADVAELNHIVYGIFNVNAWKAQVSQILFKEIRGLDLKPTTEKLKTTVENQLTAVIDRINEQIRRANRGSFSGRIKQMLIDLVVDIKQVRKGVPAYADAVINEVTRPETEKLIKDLAAQRLNTYLSKSSTELNMELINEVLKRTGTTSAAAASQKLIDEIKDREQGLTIRGYTIIGLALLLFAWTAIPRNRTRFNFAVLFSTLIILLAVGVSVPMLDLEAKISEMSFSLIGHRVAFENQILYFQSKSILDVFWLMITHPDAKMKLVGVLLVLFSIVLPIVKMASSVAFCYFEKARHSRVVQAFTFKTGKWSMADVMVVAILMAYIGFNGIIETQFDKMKALVPDGTNFFTTNGTTLQMGFYIFLSYAVLALVLSSYLKKSFAEKNPRGPEPTALDTPNRVAVSAQD